MLGFCEKGGLRRNFWRRGGIRTPRNVRKLAKNDPGVIKIGLGCKHAHTIYSVPESAVRRIHTRLLMGR